MPAKAKAKAPERDLFDEAGALVAAAGRDVPRKFVRTLFGRVPEEDLAPYTPQALADLAATAYEHLSAPRRNDGADLRLIDREVERGGGRRDITAIEVVNENMPFLLDSTLAELVEQGYEPRLVAHPILAVERDESGALARLVGEATASAPVGARRESFIQIHLDRVDDEAARQRLVEGLAKVYADVAVSVRDWPGMRTRIAEAIYSYRANPPPLPADEVSEAIAFLDWLADDNFTFLGMREYRLPKGDAAADPIEESGLGLLRDPTVKVLRRGGELLTMSPEIRAFLARPKALISTKANVKSRVHRRVHLDYIGVKLFSAEGRLQGELRIIGLFTASAYTSSLNEVPYLRHKVAKVTARAGFDPASYAGRSLLNVLENYPRDELFQIDEETLYRFAIEIMNLSERPRIRALARPDEFARFVSVLVFVPKDRYDTAVRRPIGGYLARAYKGRMSAAYPSYPEGPLARTHYIIGRDEGATPQIPQEELEAGIAAIVRTWADALAAALAETIGGSRARALAARYSGAFSAAYREAFGAEQSIEDITILERLSAERPRAVNLYPRAGDPDTRVNLKVFSRGASLPLSERVPLLENLGFRVVNERTYRVDPPGGEDSGRIWLHDMALERAAGGALDIGAIEGPIEATILALFRGLAESDAFNKLVLEAELGWRDVAMVRAFGRYLRQIRLAFGHDYLAATLARHGAMPRKVAELFYARFDPRGADQRAEAEARVRAEIEGMLQAVESLEDDRILRRFVNLVEAAVRTNFFQIDENGLPRQTIAFKFECGRVDGLPLPKPLYEIFLYSPRVEGLHLRFGKVARGGIRWSDRPQDFRTEVLGLVKAQQVKNAVIVPVGAKGGFIPKYLPSGPREAVQAEGTAAYTIFISSLLDITDNLGPDGVIPPENVIRYDDDDPYLVVAADKGTATFSDTANRISLDHGFWLGDAFASGGSAGYDHKKMGITARGAWEAVRRHFREMDIDITTAPFTVAGIGDMSGDVFGNGMLRENTIKLVAAFDHRDIIIDPNPDAERSFAERQRLFDLSRSSWQDYNKDYLSAGGGIYSRKAKEITLSAEAQALLGLAEKVTPQQAMTAILRLNTDLLWFGGIGTYIRASSETDDQVGDRVNDPIRVTGAMLRCKVIGEGANLGVTQRGRVEAAMRGVRLNTDAIDNSAGVNTSDVEVNIKIALSIPVRDGRLTLETRNTLLAEMTDEVARLVLRNNYQQTLALSLAQRRGLEDLGFQQRLMQVLEQRGQLDRTVEFLPDDSEIGERRKRGQGLTRPEFAVLLAYAKLTLYSDLLDSSVPDDPYLGRELSRYFPKELVEGYPDALENHRLRREIISTQLTNSMINRGGPSFAVRIGDQTGASPSTIAAAFFVVRNSYDMIALNSAIDALDNKVSGKLQLELYAAIEDLLLDRIVWFVRNADVSKGLADVVEHYRAGIELIVGALYGVLPEDVERALAARTAELEKAGVPEELARRLANLRALAAAPDIISVADRTDKAVQDVAATYYAAGAFFQLDRISNAARSIQVTDYFARLALDRALDSIGESERRLTAEMVGDGVTGPEAVEAWVSPRASEVERIRAAVHGIASSGLTISKLSVAASLLGDLARH